MEELIIISLYRATLKKSSFTIHIFL